MYQQFAAHTIWQKRAILQLASTPSPKNRVVYTSCHFSCTKKVASSTHLFCPTDKCATQACVATSRTLEKYRSKPHVTPPPIHTSTFATQSRLAERYANARLPARLSPKSRVVYAPLTQIAWSSHSLPHRIHILGLLLSPVLLFNVKIRQVQNTHAAFRFYAVVQLLIPPVHGSHRAFHSCKRP